LTSGTNHLHTLQNSSLSYWNVRCSQALQPAKWTPSRATADLTEDTMMSGWAA